MYHLVTSQERAIYIPYIIYYHRYLFQYVSYKFRDYFEDGKNSGTVDANLTRYKPPKHIYLRKYRVIYLQLIYLILWNHLILMTICPSENHPSFRGLRAKTHNFRMVGYYQNFINNALTYSTRHQNYLFSFFHMSVSFSEKVWVCFTPLKIQSCIVLKYGFMWTYKYRIQLCLNMSNENKWWWYLIQTNKRLMCT